MGTVNKVFGENENQNENANVTSADALKLLVGDDAKYKTVEDLALAALHGQTHIATLEKENAGFRTDAEKQTSLTEILAAIKGGDEHKPSDDNQNQNDNSDNGSEEVDVSATIEQALNKRESANTAKSNAAIVKAALSKALGDKAGSVYSKAIDEFGVDLDALAEKSPQAVINLVLQQRPDGNTTHALPQSTQRNEQPRRDTGDMNYEAIQAVYKDGKIPRHEKIRLENEMLTKLGSSRFWNK